MPERRRTRAQERADAIDISPKALVAQIEKLAGELDAARKEGEEYLAALQRERAEFQNFRRRTAEERMRDLGLAGEDLIRKVLAVADDFDRAIEARPASIAHDPWFDGIAAIDRKLRQLLESEGVTAIEADGRPAVRPAGARSHRQRARHRARRGRDRRGGPARVSTPRSRPPAGPRGGGRRRHRRHRGNRHRNHDPRTSTKEQHATWARSSASIWARRTPSLP